MEAGRFWEIFSHTSFHRRSSVLPAKANTLQNTAHSGVSLSFWALAEAVWNSRSCALPARMPLAHDYVLSFLISQSSFTPLFTFSWFCLAPYGMNSLRRV